MHVVTLVHYPLAAQRCTLNSTIEGLDGLRWLDCALGIAPEDWSIDVDSRIHAGVL